MEIQQAGLRFHKACFKCDGCGKGLVGVPYKLSTAGKPPLPLCMDCWYERHGGMYGVRRAHQGRRVQGRRRCLPQGATSPSSREPHVRPPRRRRAARRFAWHRWWQQGARRRRRHGRQGRRAAAVPLRLRARTAAMTLAMDYASLE